MQLALAALRILGGLVLGLVLGISAIQVMGTIQPDLVGLLVPIVIYAVIGGAVVAIAPTAVGVALLVGWAAPWILVLLVVADDGVNPYLPFPGIVTVVYVLALGVAWYRSRHRLQGKGTG